MGIYKVVGYLSTMWYTLPGSQPHDIETRNGKENGHSYSYMEAIDTVNN